MGWGKGLRKRRRRAFILDWVPAPPFIHMVSLCELEKQSSFLKTYDFYFPENHHIQINGAYDVNRTPLDMTLSGSAEPFHEGLGGTHTVHSYSLGKH